MAGDRVRVAAGQTTVAPVGPPTPAVRASDCGSGTQAPVGDGRAAVQLVGRFLEERGRAFAGEGMARAQTRAAGDPPGPPQRSPGGSALLGGTRDRSKAHLSENTCVEGGWTRGSSRGRLGVHHWTQQPPALSWAAAPPGPAAGDPEQAGEGRPTARSVPVRPWPCRGWGCSPAFPPVPTPGDTPHQACRGEE